MLKSAGPALAADQFFFIKPYLQLGFEAKKDSPGMDIVWFSEEAKHKWQLRYTTAKTKEGKDSVAESITERMISLPGFVAPYYKVTAHIAKLPAGQTFNYKVFRDEKEVFAATGKARKESGQGCRIAIFGDCGINGEGQKKLAKHIAKSDPDLIVIPGDIAYQFGRFSEYVSNFFPVYNLDPAKVLDPVSGKTSTVSSATAEANGDGYPLMRSILTAGVIGNHDIALSGMTGTNLNKFPDALGYFIFWNQPLNGFGDSKELQGKSLPYLAGDPNRQELFKKSAGDAFPRGANYSFDYGDVHFTALDGNYYMDWTNPKLRTWLAEDLKGAQSKTWRILVMHHPPFLIGAAHETEQRMRLITDIAEKYKVDMMIAGHAHCYERSYPFTFAPKDGAKTLTMPTEELVAGNFTLDKDYDGVKKTKPKGIIYVVSGAGGARLYPINQQAITAPGSYMCKWDCSTHSFSSLDVDGKSITFRQITEDGKELDKFVITK
ncbi:MAG: metallophosphoesterase [Cyanobacteria bacterium SZAS TMP-1]|nr:metallophosphoesterase [Cyanobacteria bacterium SZAS TMP-1]